MNETLALGLEEVASARLSTGCLSWRIWFQTPVDCGSEQCAVWLSSICCCLCETISVLTEKKMDLGKEKSANR